MKLADMLGLGSSSFFFNVLYLVKENEIFFLFSEQNLQISLYCFSEKRFNILDIKLKKSIFKYLVILLFIRI